MRPFIGCGRCCEGREGDRRSVITGRLRCNGELLEIDVVGRNHGRRPGRTQLFTWATMVRVIYEKPMPKATLAHMYSASRQTMGPTLSWRAKFVVRQSHDFVCDGLLFDCDREAINRAPEPRAQLRAPRVPRAARVANAVFVCDSFMFDCDRDSFVVAQLRALRVPRAANEARCVAMFVHAFDVVSSLLRRWPTGIGSGTSWSR